MQNFLMWTQIITCIILIMSILFQDTKGVPQASYGGNNHTYFKPRGKEAFLNNLTKISGIILFAISIVSLMLK